MRQLNPADLKNVLILYLIYLARIIVDNKCPWNILRYNEAHFTQNGAVNSQNFRIWGSARLYAVHKRSLHLDCITV